VVVVRQIVVPFIKRISSYLGEVLRFRIAGPIRRKMLGEHVNRASAGLQEERFGLQKNSS
jgi:hypothetical protein